MTEIDTLRELFTYCNETGILYWNRRSANWFKTHRAHIQWNNRYAGKEAGTMKQGYLIVSVQKTLYRAHMIAYAMNTGSWPTEHLDHINGVRNDNRFSNLRLAGHAENSKNKRLQTTNKTGFHGVSVCPSGKYRAKGWSGNKQTHLVYFSSLEEAAMAKRRYEKEHGFHANHGVTA